MKVGKKYWKHLILLLIFNSFNLLLNAFITVQQKLDQSDSAWSLTEGSWIGLNTLLWCWAQR